MSTLSKPDSPTGRPIRPASQRDPIFTPENYVGRAWHPGRNGWRPIYGKPIPIKRGIHKGKWWVRSPALGRRWRTDSIRLADGTRLLHTRKNNEGGTHK